ncbi:hypothetical protein DCAR_0105015 [Daucus carota subsp. sativus]|uniref:Serine hydroxymethyltransferase-like domain-containing protein n=1 Tax=Daucus carota subsp. sativus TaxID=79200 RepID=A0AAF0W9K5_DAUCS|nr:PREDICTED: serine hydroxymethyltransferase 1, mitochondrial-like [Daucus carota subsp. sativus]WOG85822.1 hypothetical protein DCAR_0105015 [Daucus carota subsp. sativus]
MLACTTMNTCIRPCTTLSIESTVLCFRLQGEPHNQTIAGIAVAPKETLTDMGYELVSGGTENHSVLVNLKNKGIDGSKVEKVLESVAIAANKNTVPGDVSAMVPEAIRMGTPALTSRGFSEPDFINAAVQLASRIKANTKGPKLKDFVKTIKDGIYQSEITKLKHEVEEYAKQFLTVCRKLFGILHVML